MIFLTGDTHGVLHAAKLNSIQHFIRGCRSTDDIVIVLGDFGYGWDPKVTSQLKNLLADKTFTLLFIDGNHDNHDYLATLSRAPMFGSEVGVIPGAPIPIYHLLRGKTYTIQGHSFYALGGAHSHDKQWRTRPLYTGRSKAWWADELPTPEFLSSLNPATAASYILTHQAPLCYFPIDPATHQRYNPDPEEMNFLFHLGALEHGSPYKKWFFGHWHIDNITPTYSEKEGIALFQNVYLLNPDGTGDFILDSLSLN